MMVMTANIKTFHLPDLGEGLPDATVVEWLVKEGDVVKLDEPLVSMETAKAVVEVPAPYSGKVTKLHGKNGDVIDTGAALVEIEIDPKLPQRAEAESTGHHHAPKAAAPKSEAAKGPGSPAPDDPKKVIASEDGGEISTGGKAPATRIESVREDAGTVVGAMEASDRVVSESAVAVGGVKAVPAVRALAKKLQVDLSKVVPSGAGGVVTLQDVKKAAEAGTAKLGAKSVLGAPADRHPASPSAAARDAIQGIAQAQQLRPHPALRATFSRGEKG